MLRISCKMCICLYVAAGGAPTAADLELLPLPPGYHFCVSNQSVIWLLTYNNALCIIAAVIVRWISHVCLFVCLSVCLSAL